MEEDSVPPPTSRRSSATSRYAQTVRERVSEHRFHMIRGDRLRKQARAISTILLYLGIYRHFPNENETKSSLLGSVQRRFDSIAARLCVSKQHLGVGSVEHRVRDVRISTCSDRVSMLLGLSFLSLGAKRGRVKSFLHLLPMPRFMTITCLLL